MASIGRVILTPGIPGPRALGFLGPVDSESDMTALDARLGEYCYRTDLTGFFYLVASPASEPDNWIAPVGGALDGGTASSSITGFIDGGGA